MGILCKQFLSTFLRRQPFGLPDSMIYYILKNPKSSKVYQKLIQCCKYFFVKNPILVIHCLEIHDDGWKTCTNQTNCKVNFHQTIDNRILSNCKLWIDNRIRIISTDSNVAADLIPEIYQNDATKCYFANQKMSIQQFLFYAQNAKVCVLDRVILSSDINAEIPIEEIVANLPHLLRIYIKYHLDSRNATTDTVKKLLQIPHFKNLTHFRVYNASENFDIDAIYDYYKKNDSRFTFRVYYQDGLSEAFIEKLEGIVDEILDYKFYDNKAPFIGYPEQSYDDYYALKSLR